MNSEINELTSNKSKLLMDFEKNREMYAQYLVLYNQLDQRDYFPIEGGVGVEEKEYDSKLQYFRDMMWKKPWWRALIGFCKKTG